MRRYESCLLRCCPACTVMMSGHCVMLQAVSMAAADPLLRVGDFQAADAEQDCQAYNPKHSASCMSCNACTARQTMV